MVAIEKTTIIIIIITHRGLHVQPDAQCHQNTEVRYAVERYRNKAGTPTCCFVTGRRLQTKGTCTRANKSTVWEFTSAEKRCNYPGRRKQNCENSHGQLVWFGGLGGGDRVMYISGPSVGVRVSSLIA